MNNIFRIFSLIIFIYCFSSCAEQKDKARFVNYYTYASRTEQINVKKYEAIISKELEGSLYKYIGDNDTITCFISNNENLNFYVLGEDTTLFDTLQSHVFIVNKSVYKVYRLIFGSYSTDGQRSVFINKEFGILGSRSENWRSFTKQMFGSDTSQVSILTDVVFEFDEWKCKTEIPPSPLGITF